MKILQVLLVVVVGVSAAAACEGGTCRSTCREGEEQAEGRCGGRRPKCCVPGGGGGDDGDCGVLMANHIIGGKDSGKSAWPWQVSLQYPRSGDFHFCGGTLIKKQWVLTAAHCVDGERPGSLQVDIGEHDHTEDDGTERIMRVSKIIMHGNYDKGSGTFPNDIALIKLEAPVEYNNHIKAACMPTRGMEFTGNGDCWISGWGNTENGTPDVLQEKKVDVHTNSDCSNAWGSSIINSQICVGNGYAACNGDSGGPLSCRVGGKWYVAGATSWGRSGCQTSGYPSVYSRVSEFRDWIDDTIMSN